MPSSSRNTVPDHGMQIFDLTQLRNVKTPPVVFQETAHGTTTSVALILLP